MSIELVHIYRGNEIESIHRGDIVAVNQSGEVLFKYGDPMKRTFWRSSAKPFQIIPFIESGGLESYDIQTQELSLMTSSHGGEAEHERVLLSILSKLGKQLSDLDCGISRPMYEGAYKRLLEEHIPFSQANNPCSGKHTGMLGLGLIKGMDLHNYILAEHPIQQMMLNIVSEMVHLDPASIDIAIDGCGVPVFGLPIYNMAVSYAQLAGPFDSSIPRQKTLQTIAHAMTTEPYYVAGTSRLDTIIMEETQGRILAKLGAESVYCMSVMNQGIGIAMKTEDGSYRALDSVIPTLLLKHGYINQNAFDRINARLPLKVKNHRQQVVGVLKSCL